MHLVTTRDAARLTGLSTEQLREWTVRRALIPADVRPKGHGSPARYTWQTLLLLRVAAVLREHFKLELQAHRTLFLELSERFQKASFLSLWGKSLVLYGGEAWNLLEPEDTPDIEVDFIVIQLNPHLRALETGFSFKQPAPPAQFQLFPAQGVAIESKVSSLKKS